MQQLLGYSDQIGELEETDVIPRFRDMFEIVSVSRTAEKHIQRLSIRGCF